MSYNYDDINDLFKEIGIWEKMEDRRRGIYERKPGRGSYSGMANRQ